MRFQLANQPDELIKILLLDIIEKGQLKVGKETDETPNVSSTVLLKLLYVIGHVAIKHMVHLDISVYKELKRRNAVREMQGKSKQRVASKGVSATPDHRIKSGNMSLSARQNVNVSRNRDVSQLNTEENNGEEALEGAIDDAEAEFINGALENEIVTGNGLLARFVYVYM